MKGRFLRWKLQSGKAGETILQYRSVTFWVVNLLFRQVFIQSSLKYFLDILLFSLLKMKRLENLQLSIKSVPPGFIKHALRKTLSIAAQNLDLNRVVCVSEELARHYGLHAGEWVMLFTAEGTNKFPCQVVITPKSINQLETTTVYMTPVALCNFKSTVGVQRRVAVVSNVHIVPTIFNEATKQSSGLGLGMHELPARVARLSRVSSVESAENIEALLKNYFERRRFLQVGDLVVAESAQDDGTLLKVMNIEADPVQDNRMIIYSASVATTSVFLHDKEVQSFRPILQEDYCMMEDGSIRVIPTCSPCLESYVSSVCDWVDNFSQFNSNRKGHAVDSELWPTILINGPVGSGKYTVCNEVARREGMNLHVVNVASIIGDTSAFTIAKLLSGVAQRAKNLEPCIVLLKNVHFLGKDKDGEEDRRVIMAFVDLLNEIHQSGKDEGNSVFFVGTTHCLDQLVPSLRDCFIHKITVEPLRTDAEILKYFEWRALQCPHVTYDFDLPSWLGNSGAKNVLKFSGDLKAFTSIALKCTQMRSSEKVELQIQDSVTGLTPLPDSSNTHLVIQQNDFEAAFDQLELDLRASVGCPKVPVVSWSDIGGLPNVKKELISSVQLPLKFPHLFTSGLKRSGILLYGPPGTGKTLLAKAVASEFKISFLSVKGPELLNMYVGQSEQNVREVFQKARDSSPCVLFFDELDSLAPNRGKSGDSGGVMDRVVSQILAELDGTHSTPNVFIIGATNRPDLIDPALLRPGRFDKLVYVGVSSDASAAGSIMKALTRKFRLDSNVNLDQIAAELPSGMSGADLSALCSEAFMTAITRRVETIEAGETDADGSVSVSQEDFLCALAKVRPSLTTAELNKYEQLQSLVR